MGLAASAIVRMKVTVAQAPSEKRFGEKRQSQRFESGI